MSKKVRFFLQDCVQGVDVAAALYMKEHEAVLRPIDWPRVPIIFLVHV